MAYDRFGGTAGTVELKRMMAEASCGYILDGIGGKEGIYGG